MKIHPTNCRVLSFIVAVCLVSACSAQSRPMEPEYWPTENWKFSTPEAQGMRSENLAEMLEIIQKDELRLHSLLIIRNGYIVLESYWSPYGPNDTHTIESNTKSIIGALVGKAIELGALRGLDDKMVDLFPGRLIRNLDEQKEMISVRDLLSMTPGLPCQDLSSSGRGMFEAEDWTQYLLDLPMNEPPGTRWVYCSGAAHLLSAALQSATNQDTRSYANTHLFRPLGIPDVTSANWGTDPQGVTNGIAGLYMRPRDLAKFGILYLDRGKWGEQQVLPAEWVDESTREQAYIGPDDYLGGIDRRFGYMWSIFPEQGYYGFMGMAGQELFVIPEKNMVVVFTGGLEVGKEASLLKLVNTYILPAATSVKALSPDPESNARLDLLTQAAAGSARPIPPLPQAALELSGKTFRLDPNPLDWEDITFSFSANSDEAALKVSGQTWLAIGLDGRYRLTDQVDSRPAGLRGRWRNSEEFELDHILLGEFVESSARIVFSGEQLTMFIKSHNYGGPELVIKGASIP